MHVKMFWQLLSQEGPTGSHCSVPATIESPHVVEHTSICPERVHVQPGEEPVHPTRHPSPSSVPSSHASVPFLSPSPHVVEQAYPPVTPEQSNPES